VIGTYFNILKLIKKFIKVPTYNIVYFENSTINNTKKIVENLDSSFHPSPSLEMG